VRCGGDGGRFFLPPCTGDAAPVVTSGSGRQNSNKLRARCGWMRDDVDDAAMECDDEMSMDGFICGSLHSCAKLKQPPGWYRRRGQEANSLTCCIGQSKLELTISEETFLAGPQATVPCVARRLKGRTHAHTPHVAAALPPSPTPAHTHTAVQSSTEQHRLCIVALLFSLHPRVQVARFRWPRRSSLCRRRHR
jgi:hypothetical protein